MAEGALAARPPEVRRFSTADTAEAHEHIGALYGLAHRITFSDGDRAVTCRTASYELDGVHLTHLAYSAEVHASIKVGLQRPTFVTSQRSRVLRYEMGGSVLPADRGRSVGLPPEHSYEAHWDALDTRIVQLSPATLAEDAVSETPGPVRFFAGHSVSAAAEQNWTSVSSFVDRMVLTTSEATASPLLRRELVRLLNTTALATFPSSVLTADHPTWSPTPAAVRRAVAFIDEHAAEPISLADIAEAARVSARALQDGFRRHLGATPLEHLRKVRLDLAHRELLDAHPSEQTSVAEIARRWGFTNQGRFARLHRERYGTLPAEVLRRG